MIVWLTLMASALVLFYTFAGYPVLLYLRARLRPRPVAKGDVQPSITVLIAAHNEERVIKRKLDSILRSTYAPDRINVIVVSDGSNDGTEAILLAYHDKRVRPILLDEHVGKAAALNFGVREATGEIVVFTDARQPLEHDSLRQLARNFADPQVGCVSGLLMIGDLSSAAAFTGEHLKWKFENVIREWEGSAGSVVGALGAFYGARRSLITEIPTATLLDDCYVPLHIVRRGYRTVFEKNARVWDDVVTTPAQEFSRKVRTLTGNYQLLQLAPWLLTCRNPIWWEFLSHKICRLLVPFLSVLMLAASLCGPGLPLLLFGFAQLAAYSLGLAALSWRALGERFRPAEVARSVLVLNAATVMAFVNFATGRYSVWTRPTASSPEMRIPTSGIP